MANWTEEEKRKIWDKGEIVPGYDKNVWRKDQAVLSSNGTVMEIEVHRPIVVGK